MFWAHQMEILGDVGHVEYRFGPFGDNVSVGGSEIILDAPD